MTSARVRVRLSIEISLPMKQKKGVTPAYGPRRESGTQRHQ